MTDDDYIERIEQRTEQAYEVAEAAREQGKDPEPRVDIPVAEDLAAKAVGLVTADQFPELEDTGIVDRIRGLEDEYRKNDERVALVIGKEIAQEEFYEWDDRERAVDAGLRIGLSYMTGGIVTAPLEGVADVVIRDNDDGTQYLAVHYSGPIRSAGGTASAMSVLLADYIRKEVGIDRYKPREEELDRYATEVEDYYTRVTKKQYTPERKETKMIAEHVPVEVTGTPTEEIEVSNYKDLPRIHTNRIRGGMCLVYLDGLPLKASKLLKRIENFGEEFGLEHWDWLEEYLELQHEIHASGSDEEEDEEQSYEPSDKYLGSLTAGRPIMAHPGKRGGFRLRYGRGRTAGLAAVAFHPATLEITDRFMAIGTQMKVEYPGKATVVTPCDTIAPPVVRLEDGSVKEVETREEAAELKGDIDRILFLGDMLVPYGEFLENGKTLLPSPYVAEWWAQEVAEAAETSDADIAVEAYVTEPYETPNVRTAVTISRTLDVALHPHHTYFWDCLEDEDIEALHAALQAADGRSLPRGDGVKQALERLYVPHEADEDEITLDEETCFVMETLLQPDETTPDDFTGDVLGGIADASGIEVREQGTIFLGSRMGRPEKAEHRMLKGRPQVLFPCGQEEGGRLRNLVDTYREGSVTTEILNNQCPECGDTVHFAYCPSCGVEAEELRKCVQCDRKTQDEQHCGRDTVRSWKTTVDVDTIFGQALDTLGMQKPPDMVKSPRGVTGRHKHVEPVEKGLLRERHELYVNKDGTIRYDATDIPMTHFRPREIGVSVDRLKELGYTHDIHGEPLEDEEQVLELQYQDVIIPDNDRGVAATDYLTRTAKFVDDLLEEFYGLDPYYDVEEPEDLVGQLVVGLAPHTSGGVVGRIIGFTDAKGVYAHPFWHAAKRRNCDGDEDSIMLLMDALLNFSRQFLPDQRGTRTMDAPLILSTVLLPDEVDDESWNVDIVDEYPVGFYEATHDMVGPGEVDIAIAEDAIDEDVSFGYTHETHDVMDAPLESNYVTLGEMAEKVKAQLAVGKLIDAVEADSVAELLLEKHFLTDIKGNLRAFSKQTLQCQRCNEKYRRAPLKGRCTATMSKGNTCNGKLRLTVPEGGIKKYLYHSEEIADTYAISPYLRQQIMILKENIESLFGKDDRQSSLSQFSS